MLQDNYVFRRRPGGPEVIAGRPAVVLEARPREIRKDYWRLWLDRDGGFILKIERYHADQTLVSLSTFETINFNPSLPEELFQILDPPPRSRWEPTTRQELQTQLGTEAVLPTHLPYGYQLHQVLCEQEELRLQAHLLYTDGLDTISLFALRPAPPRNWRRLKAQRVHGQPVWIDREGPFQVLSWQAGEVEQNLVTELPRKALAPLVATLISPDAPPPPAAPRPWLPTLGVALLVFLLLRRCLRPRWQ